MIEITTERSIYALDATNRRVMRLRGEADPTPRQDDDGEWTEFRSMHLWVYPDGEFCFFFDWTGQGNGTRTGLIKDLKILA